MYGSFLVGHQMWDDKKRQLLRLKIQTGREKKAFAFLLTPHADANSEATNYVVSLMGKEF